MVSKCWLDKLIQYSSLLAASLHPGCEEAAPGLLKEHVTKHCHSSSTDDLLMEKKL